MDRFSLSSLKGFRTLGAGLAGVIVGILSYNNVVLPDWFEPSLGIILMGGAMILFRFITTSPIFKKEDQQDFKRLYEELLNQLETTTYEQADQSRTIPQDNRTSEPVPSNLGNTSRMSNPNR